MQQLAVARPVLVPPASPAPPTAPTSAGGTSSAAGDGWAPPAGFPSLKAITYVKEAATTLLIVLALPYVVFKLLTAPGELLANVGRRHVKP